METKIYRQDRKKWTLPIILSFSKTEFNFIKPNMCFYNVLGYRKPKRGEYFLSGAIIKAYKAHDNLNTEYLIAKPTDKAKQSLKWVKA